VALERRRQLELLLDPVQAGGEQRGEGEVGVDVAARDPRLGPQRLAVADDAKGAGAVVMPPGERGRRPRARGVALVRVDRRREEEREFPRARDPAREPTLERVALAVERIPALL